MEILRIENLSKKYNQYLALKNINFSVEESEFVAIMGASGSGKTSLLNCIATIDQASSGNIYLNGQLVSQLKAKHLAKFRRQNLGFIFQNFNLLDNLTAYENIALALTINKYPIREIDAKVQEIAKLLDIESQLDKYPYQMSGGQQQRIACARAIIHQPSLILADEPTGALDSNASKLLMNSLINLNQKLQATVLMVTHDAYIASYASRVIFLKDGQIYKQLQKTSEQKVFFELILREIEDLENRDA